MSSLNAERLYALLPEIHRIRDHQQGEPLRALVALIAREFEAIEENLEQLYDDQFIETCDDWVAPYIGDLIGYRPLHGTTTAVASPRAEVANTIAYRRRKGTAAMLEQLARDVTGWPARAVEFFEQLATTQYMKHPRLQAPATVDLRATPSLFAVDTAFNRIAHTAEMRRPETGAGRWNIPNIGLFLWRLQPQSLSRIPLVADPGDASGRRQRLNPLGIDAPLFRKPVAETRISSLAEPHHVPAPITVRGFAAALRQAQAAGLAVAADGDYGDGLSLCLYRNGAALPISSGAPATALIVGADLRDVFDAANTFIGWAHEADVGPDQIAVDPERGRVLLGSAHAAAHAAQAYQASFQLGSVRAIGGGEYARQPAGAALPVQQAASAGAALDTALAAVRGGGRLRLDDSLRYALPATLSLDGETGVGLPGRELVIAARDGARPLLQAGGDVLLDIGPRGRLVLDGLVIAGGTLRIAAPAAGDVEPRRLVIRHCTLLPGLALNPDGRPVSPGAPSLVVDNGFVEVLIEDTICGAIHAVAEAELSIRDSIIDAGAAHTPAIAGSPVDEPGASLSIVDSTVIGRVHVERLHLASNSLFDAAAVAGDPLSAPVEVERRQEGCARFSFIPAGSRVPRRHRCLPDDDHPDARVQFTSRRYGDPAYGQLRPITDAVIRSGADDGSEIGVLRPLQQPQRESNLRTRLDEYLRFGLRAGFFHAS